MELSSPDALVEDCAGLSNGEYSSAEAGRIYSANSTGFCGVGSRGRSAAGVVNVITGDGSTGELLVQSPVDKIAFTGSTDVGRAIRRATAGSGKRISLELGGKSPFVVFDDADLDSVVEGLVDAIWFNQGQVCCAGSRLLIQESIEEVLLDKLDAAWETLRIGEPLDKSIASARLLRRSMDSVSRRLCGKASMRARLCGNRHGRAQQRDYFFPTNVIHGRGLIGHDCAGPQIFGPVLGHVHDV